MKKLMIAAAIVCSAAVSQAATVYNWQINNGAIGYGETYDEIEGNTWVGGTYYLMQGDATAQSAFVTTLIAAGADGLVSAFGTHVANAVNSANFSTESYEMSNPAEGEWSSDMWGVEWDMTDTRSLPFYQVLLDAGNNAVYLSEVANSDYTMVGDTYITFNNSGFNTYEDAESFKGEGWYGFTSGGGDDPSGGVPEPTSGLLLLVGLAGLALKRKIA